MSLDKIIIKPEILKRIKTKNNTNLIKSHISEDELNSNPLIKAIVKKIRKIKLNSLTNLKPHLTPIKGIKNEKVLKLVDNVDSFREIFYNYNINQKVPKNNEPKVYRGQKNYNFSKLYKHVKEKNNLGQKEMLEEIEEIYKNNNFSLPSIDKNLFNGNLLLINENSIKNSIEYKLSSEKSNKNSLVFLKKMQKNINDQIVGKNNNFSKLGEFNTDIINNEKKANNKPKNKEIKENIPQSRKYIDSIKETINDIEDLDYFFDSNNKEYFNYLKNPESIKNSKNSTRVNSSLLDFPNQSNKNIDIYKLKIRNGMKKNNSCPDISGKNHIDFNKINNINDINIYNINYFKAKPNKEKKIAKNNSMDNINNEKTKNLIKIKKLYLNGELKVPLNKKILGLKIQTNDKILPIEKRISINVQKPITFDKLINLLPQNNLRASMPFSKRQNDILNSEKSTLEQLYEKIKIKEDFLESNDLIKNYLKNKRYNIEPKIAPIDICDHYQKMRDRIIRNDYFKKYIKLKKISGYDGSSYENIKNEYNTSLNKLNNLAEDVNKIISLSNI